MINLHESKGPGRIELATVGFAANHASVARHVTDCSTQLKFKTLLANSGVPDQTPRSAMFRPDLYCLHVHVPNVCPIKRMQGLYGLKCMTMRKSFFN